jgi:signal transduction histidine kinase/Pyruvate/2-oxoacid:ferredoxin oxidoreductase delta subunit
MSETDPQVLGKQHDVTADKTLQQQLVKTIGEKCRTCYTCVRECPAKAISILDGQASVIQTRCIGCGNCVTVCSQNAKQVLSGIEDTERLLAGGAPVAAIVAPSYPAEFTECDTSELVAALRATGFDHVHEVSFGADLVAREYARLLAGGDESWISTTCPAVGTYVRKYHPTLIDKLTPIVSPMMAMARVLQVKYGPEIGLVFIGPCIAKKGEAQFQQFEGLVDAVLTFAELRTMLDQRGIALTNHPEQTDEFDEPRGSLGALFPIARGLLQAADLTEDLITGEIVTAEGMADLVHTINELEAGATAPRLLEILCCDGCIMGPGFTDRERTYIKSRAAVSDAVRRRQAEFDQEVWQANMAKYGDIDLSRYFLAWEQRFRYMPTDEEMREILARMNKITEEDELDCGACGYESCRSHAVAIWQGLAEVEMCLPYTVEELRKSVDKLRESHRSLEATKAALVKSEKLASMGQLAAGIAHEVNNPLGILLLHATLLLEEYEDDSAEADDLKLIVDQANRCKRIISGLLNFARQSRVVREPTDLPGLAAQVLRTLPVDDGITVAVENDLADPIADVDADQMVQVLTNLLTNAQQAMPDGGKIVITLDGTEDTVLMAVHDTGTGIAEEHLEPLFSPFFTTKQVGKGTGLGLAVTHGIVKMHRGQITVESNADPAAGPTYTKFTISLPRRATEATVPAGLQEISGIS